MATITYRRLDPNGDPYFGSGQASFVSDLDAVAQAILTRLRLLEGEWWEATTAGTPMFQSLLGVAGAGKHPDAAALILQQRILGTPHVTGISNVATSYNADRRAFQFSCQVSTQFGTLTVVSSPGASAAI